jgi:hypothetical protein
VTAPTTLQRELRAAEVAVLRSLRAAAGVAVALGVDARQPVEEEPDAALALASLLAELGRVDALLSEAIVSAGGATVLPASALVVGEDGSR